VSGQLVVGASAALLLAGALGVIVRVRVADARPFASSPTEAVAGQLNRLNDAAKPISLVDQSGRTIALEQFRGRPGIVTFAYAHCQTVCPVLVSEVLGARDALAAPKPVVLIVTLDPWRDTPARLAAITRAWNLPAGVRLLGGTVAEVERTLDGWKIPRARDGNTGEIVHPTSVYFIDKRGRLAFLASGDASRLAALIGRL